MPIYSRNRTGFMEAAQTPADTSYNVNDFGRILYESQQNDMAFFEAILQADFNEVKGLNEGTILESEVTALNEASKNELIQKIKDSVKKVLAKLKGIIRNAIDNIANYTSTKYAELVHKFAAIPADKIANWNGSITIRTFDINSDVFMYGADSSIYNYDSSAEVCGRSLHNNIYKNFNGTLNASEFTKLAIEKCASEITYNKSNVNELKNSLKTGRDQIRGLKVLEKSITSVLNTLIASTSSEDREDKDSNQIINVVSGLENYVTILTRSAISAVRNDMRSKATGMVKIIAAINKTPKELKEAYILEAAEDFDEIMNGEFNQGLIDDEARTNIENLLKATEE